MIRNKKELKEYLAYEKLCILEAGTALICVHGCCGPNSTGFGSICGHSGMRNIIKTEFPAKRIPGR